MESNAKPIGKIVIQTSTGDKEVTSFVPEVTDNLALVDLPTLQRITAYLPKANVGEIKRDIIMRIDEARELHEVVSIMKTEVNFHETVNLITKYNHEVKAELKPQG